MRKAYLLIAAACVTFVACERKTTDNTTVTLPVGYVLNNVSDITVERDSVATVTIMVDQAKGRVQENVNISITGLPNTVTAKITPENGTPTFESMITFKASDAAVPGTYPIKIVAKSESGSREYNVNLIVAPISECASKLVGDFLATDQCDTNAATSDYSVTVSPVTGKPNRIMMSGFLSGTIGSTSGFFANLDCNNKTLTLPKQSIMFYQVSGTGSYTKDTIKVNYTVMSSFDTVVCTTILSREP
ncbi:hypothetical protein [Polluticoccus soli]|uniref:hypothetical protein n=1 Tax=Polluticoccus soli TaxID=3034150 RepID=UPI0023E25E17|nr:hypothetical protein [Flavipsychrobacter sp. JY13-12]